jgi:hypothetical protein
MTTKSQDKAIEWLRQKFTPRQGYEFKLDETITDTFETVRGEQTLVYLKLETGLIGDENTMAEIFARDRRWFVIGKRGAIKAYDGEKNRWTKELWATS